eukprot:924206-Prymnesium_polylepis.1
MRLRVRPAVFVALRGTAGPRDPRKGQGEIPGGALAPIPDVIPGRARKRDPKSGHPHTVY